MGGKGKYFIGLIITLLLGGMVSCGQRASSDADAYTLDTVLEGDSVQLRMERNDSTEEADRPYPLNSNFEVCTDTLWLRLLPFTDSVSVTRGNELVVAEVDIHPQDSVDSVWVKVARDQETIGWLPEHQLLKNTLPVDPISRCIHLFSNSHTIPFLLILAIFSLSCIYRAIRNKRVSLTGLNDIDSIFPLLLSLLIAVSATLYNSIQHFAPEMWQHYYYAPTLNPLEVPFALGLFIISVGLVFLVGIALLDDLFHQISAEVALFYLPGVASACILIYIFFTVVWVYAAYLCLILYAAWCFHRIRKANNYPYVCGSCGTKLHTKGKCPNCGAINE